MTASAKEAVREILEQVPDDASYDEIHYRIYVRQKIAEGEKAIAEGRVVSHDEVKKRLSPA